MGGKLVHSLRRTERHTTEMKRTKESLCEWGKIEMKAED